RRVDVMMKLNTGMNRLGFTSTAYRAAYERALQLQRQGVLGSVGKMTHFACADGPRGVDEPMAVFTEATAGLPGPVSVCNSAATLRHARRACGRDESHWVRPGICLYGASPFDDAPAAS